MNLFVLLTGTQIVSTSFELTKLVKFSPYFHLVNESSLDVEVAEEGNRKNWVSVAREKKIDFWPGNSESLVVCLKGERAQVSTPIKLV